MSAPGSRIANVRVRGHLVYDVDCGSCRVLNRDPRCRPRALRRRHLAPVAERDGYRCQLCRGPVDMTILPPHPSSASLDHVIPAAQGGSHDRDNLQLAHRSCNEAKADTLDSSHPQVLAWLTVGHLDGQP